MPQFGLLLYKLLFALRCSPNIEGEGSLNNNIGFIREAGMATGCVTKGTSFNNSAHAVEDIRAYALKVDASLGSNVYVSGGSVQVKALQTLICIKL